MADAVLTERGALVVTDAERLMDYAYALSRGVTPSERTLGIITVSGGAGIVATDEAERIGLPMPPMPEAAQAALREVLPYASPVNPLDCTAQALNDPSLLHSFTKAALEDGGYGAVLCFLTYVGGSPALIDRVIDALAPLRARPIPTASWRSAPWARPTSWPATTSTGSSSSGIPAAPCARWTRACARGRPDGPPRGPTRPRSRCPTPRPTRRRPRRC